ncbi:molybdate ABC transporter substrate-binding protein [Paenibacillus glufosinatiresistens]|uniref:molybdate ABC transporter substrate-binding protein n=1 Tax=Paenibacillus glufosinatiresistens TaxID=3070657 RepID=UPI00286E88CF|nr:molybdate ABC transporter substrate-binding protein [Paenibacillus sp. YX.27]
MGKSMKLTGAALAAALLLTAAARMLTSGGEAEAARKTELLVSAAASLQGSLEKIESRYEKLHPDIDLVFNYGASGTLQKQIEQGAPADLFFSAGDKQMEALVKGGLVETRTDVLKNQLVVVVPAHSGTGSLNTIRQLEEEGFKRIAIGQPESVPAGQYARQSLESKGIWKPIQNKLIFAKDVRQVLSYVETGSVDAGFVYKTDAAGSSKVKIALAVSLPDRQSIRYPLGIVKGTRHAEEAKAFYAYLQSKPARDVFVSFGFQLP